MARNRKLYTYKAVDEAMAQLADKGYEILQLEEGCLASGHIVALAPHEGWYNFETTEVALNEWSSAQTWHKFRKVPKRLTKEIAVYGA